MAWGQRVQGRIVWTPKKKNIPSIKEQKGEEENKTEKEGTKKEWEEQEAQKEQHKKEVREKEVYCQNVNELLEKHMEKNHSFLTSTLDGGEWSAALTQIVFIVLSLNYFSLKKKKKAVDKIKSWIEILTSDLLVLTDQSRLTENLWS